MVDKCRVKLKEHGCMKMRENKALKLLHGERPWFRV
jgi:hypothetical protein